MDYLLEAKKFIQRAREAVTVDVIKTHLEMGGVVPYPGDRGTRRRA